MSKPKVLPAPRRTRKPPPPPDQPGKECPNCGQQWAQPVPGIPGGYMYPLYNEAPHENPFDCIRELRRELSSAVTEIKSLRNDVYYLEREGTGRVP